MSPPSPPNKFSQFFDALGAFLEGRKTYALVAAGIVYLFGGDQGWWVVNESILGLLGFGSIATLRAGLRGKG